MTTTASAPRPTEPVNADRGSLLGVLLGSLGFGEVRADYDSYGIEYFAADAGTFAEGVLRVITWPEDGGRVKVVAFAPSTGSWVGPVRWETEFSGNTPLDSVAGFLAVTLGKLTVR